MDQSATRDFSMSFEQDTRHRINQIRARLGHHVVMPEEWPPMGNLSPRLQNLRATQIAKGLAGEMLRWRMAYWKEAGLLTDTSFFPDYDESNLDCLFAV